jgi:hypothetical protein
MSSSRSWLFRCLVIIAMTLLLVSWFLPWWSCNIEALFLSNGLVVHPYGLENNMGTYTEYIPGDITKMMPGWFTPFMWVYLGLVIVALLIGIFVTSKNVILFRRKLNLSRWLIGIVGFSYIVAIIAAYLVMYIKMGEFGMQPIGRVFITQGGYAETWITSSLKSGYWIACCVGPLLIILALLRNKIMDK